MTDGVAITPGTGVTIATDDCGVAAGQVQIIKLAVSGNGDATYLPADATRGLSVCLTQTPAGVTANGTDTAITNSAATQIIAANTARVAVLIQNTGNAPVRVGLTGVSATSGLCQLNSGEAIQLTQPFVPTDALFAIATTTTATSVLCSEVTV